MIHTTVGVYLNGDIKTNGVETEKLESHIDYNKTFRPGRALFVDGECVHSGYLSPEGVEEAKERIKHIRVNKDTAPYW